MSREKWDLIKRQKNFNVRLFRKGVKLLIFSLVLNFILGILIFYKYLNLPARDYYATNGITPPEQLTPLMAPNYTSSALLDPDPPTVTEEKVIPQ